MSAPIPTRDDAAALPALPLTPPASVRETSFEPQRRRSAHGAMTAENGAAELQRLAPRFRIRRPARFLDSLLHGYGMGACLEPLIPRDSVQFACFDPSLPADDLDVVLVRVRDDHVSWFASAMGRANARTRKEWRQLNGGTALTNLWAKVLRHGGGERWLLQGHGPAWRLEDVGQVIGVARYIDIDGQPRFGSRRITFGSTRG